ncbi:MAG: tRNA (N(6)-L-threonylcarbamoyladenosine(37)-C(2))-methylthiotransferase MtaB, partial [Monoglobaceae bacterium]
MIKIKVKFITLGCKTNMYESEAMAQLFEDDGYEVIKSGIADIYVVNTCTVTGTGASKSLKMIRRARRENPNGCLAVTGCLAQTEAERLRREENIDVLIGNEHRADIVRLCEEALKGKKTDVIRDAREITEFEELGIVHRQHRIRAEIKIEDGCNNFCSYCKIPYARGPVRSRSMSKIEEEA